MNRTLHPRPAALCRASQLPASGALWLNLFGLHRSGPRCGVMQYAVTPAAGKDLYDISDPRNTWNGPIVRDSEGKFHMYNPLYNVSSLGGPPLVMHGLADTVYGPWDWHSLPPVCEHCGENPAALVYRNAAGESVYTIWIRGHVWTSDSAQGPFTETNFKYVGGNPAPIYHNGAFYLTNQGTTAIYTTPSLDPEAGNWSVFASVDHSNVPPGAKPEDPCVQVGRRFAPASDPLPLTAILLMRVSLTSSLPRWGELLQVPLDRQARQLAHHQPRL